jgi:hypothetical protein
MKKVVPHNDLAGPRGSLYHGRTMAERTVIKQSEQVRRAIRWISEQRKDNPAARLPELLSQAGPRFNLSPSEQESLLVLLRESDQR